MALDSRGRAPRAVFGAALAIYVAGFLFVAWRAAVLSPYADQLEWVGRWFEARADGNWAAYYAPYNFHRLIWTLGAMWADLRLFSGSGVLPLVVAGACLAATAALLAQAAAEAAPRGLKLYGAGGAVLLTLMAGSALDVDQMINNTYLHALVFAVAAIVAATPRGRASAGRWLGALACLAGAALGNAAGLAAWPVLVLAAWVFGAPVAWRLGVLAGGAVGVALYAMGQPSLGGAGPSHDLHGLTQAGLLALYYLGLPWTRAVPQAGWLIGAVMLAAGLAALALFARRDGGRGDRIACQLILFSLGTAAMAAIGRTGLQAPADAPIRYAVFLTPLHVGLFMLALPRLRRLSTQHPGRTAWVAAAGAVLMLGHQAAFGLFAVRTGDIIRTTLADFRAGQRTPKMLEIVNPDLTRAEALSRRLMAEGLYPREPAGLPGGKSLPAGPAAH